MRCAVLSSEMPPLEPRGEIIRKSPNDVPRVCLWPCWSCNINGVSVFTRDGIEELAVGSLIQMSFALGCSGGLLSRLFLTVHSVTPSQPLSFYPWSPLRSYIGVVEHF